MLLALWGCRSITVHKIWHLSWNSAVLLIYKTEESRSLSHSHVSSAVLAGFEVVSKLSRVHTTTKFVEKEPLLKVIFHKCNFNFFFQNIMVCLSKASRCILYLQMHLGGCIKLDEEEQKTPTCFVFFCDGLIFIWKVSSSLLSIFPRSAHLYLKR